MTPGDSVIVPSLDRHGLYTQELDTPLDNALGLLSSHGNLSSVAAVATTWAAIEGLLGHPGGKGVDSADSLAAIVACSFPRAELEDLVDKKMVDTPAAIAVASDLQGVTGSARAKLLLDGIKRHGSDIFSSRIDVAAAERVRQAEADPHGTITRIHGYFTDVFRRLYYQRNFIMHAARFDSVSLASTTRSAPKLVAAGLDRVVHAQYVRTPVSPQALAARARNEIDMLGKTGAREIHRLLK